MTVTPPQLTKDLKISEPFLDVDIKTGFINVGKKGGHMFYAAVPKNQQSGFFSSDKNEPWGIWLQGGPGCASDFALVHENGPIRIDAHGNVSKNAYSWHNLMDMIWIDQPLGTGFSDVGNMCNYATSESDIAVNMQEFLEKFLYTHPEFKFRPLYILGESYAGHYIPAIAYHLMRYPMKELNLQGIAIGNGWVDPVKQYPAYAKFAFTHGMIDAASYQVAMTSLRECVQLVEKKSVMGMFVCGMTVSAILGKLNPYDITLKCDVPPLCYNETYIVNFLNKPSVQERLGVHKEYIECNDKVHLMLTSDWDTQTKTKIMHLLNKNYDVLIYNGMNDFICNWMGTEDWLKSMTWKTDTSFDDEQYEPWQLHGKTVGEFKKLKNLEFYKIFNAGHMVPMDQPEVAYEMIKGFISSQTYNKDNDMWSRPIQM